KDVIFDLGSVSSFESLMARFLAGDRPALAGLSRLLSGPLERAPRAGGTLVVVPDGLLAFLPFEALPGPAGRPLALRVRVVYAVSAWEWARGGKEIPLKRGGKVQFLWGGNKAGTFLPYRFGLLRERFFPGGGPPREEGLPPLPGVEASFRGEAGLEEAAKSGMWEKAGILHFRVPAFFDGLVPAAACLRLGPGKRDPGLSLWDRPDGVLTPGEILRIPLAGRVVVLWEGRMGPKGAEGAWRPEGLFCLVRAFLASGARGVLLARGPGRGPAAARFDALVLEALGKGDPARALAAVQRKWLETEGKETGAGDPRAWARFAWWEGSRP
ncbi:MAG TPA: CHAT domain-containing protein, partial [Planctomycetes bacterium]|nr:CHAT domain-containing protein [Planctomycetota bacterium]